MNPNAPENQTDAAFYQKYDRNLYKVGATGDDPVADALGSDPGANNSSSVSVPADSLGSGVSTDSSSQGYGSYSSGQEAYNDGNAGYWMGIDKDGVAKISIGPNSGNHLTFDGSTLTVVGAVNIGSLNIPDTTTANSFHVDTAGNTWWGANVATGYPGANAYILNTGSAVFKNVAIGGTAVQYVITNSGIFSYGDGSDGAVVLDGSTPFNAFSTLSGTTYTLTRDVYFTDLTLNDGAYIVTAGWRIFCSVSLTVGNGASGFIYWNGPGSGAGLGQNGTGNASGGTPGTHIDLTGGYLPAPPSAGDGGVGGSGGSSGAPGTAGSTVTNSLGSAGSSGQNGGPNGVPTAGGAGGAGGANTSSNVKLIANWHLATLLDVSSSGSTVKFKYGGGGGGGGGGTGNGAGGAGAGGAGGTNGGFVAIYAKSITINAGGGIQAVGGNGGNGSSGAAGAGNGGAGAGGNGGIVLLVYNFLMNSGTISVAAGTGGQGGGTAGSGKTAANSGSVGSIYEFQLSL